MKKVLVLIRSLNIGGAEKQLLTLTQNIDRTRIEPVILTFYSEGELLPEFSRSNVCIRSAEKGGRWDVFPFLSRLVGIIRTEKPDVVMSYLVAANLLAVILRPFFRPAKVIVSIRHSFVRREDYDWLTGMLYFLENHLAGRSDRIIVNSYAGAKMAVTRGIPAEKIVVIPNGIDTEQFHPDENAGKEAREQYGLSDDDKVAGIIGRLDPIKDHATLLKAVSLVSGSLPAIKLAIIGSGDGAYTQVIKALAQSLGIDNRVFWIPSQNNLLGIYNMLDVCISASIGEGFSNVISEAMSCQTPCIATAVGDSSMIIGETGRIVPVGSPEKMAQAIGEVFTMPAEELKQLGKLARVRIREEFGVESMVSATMTEIENLG